MVFCRLHFFNDVRKKLSRINETTVMQDARERGGCIYNNSNATCVLNFVVKLIIKTGLEVVKLHL